jgi:hypothetical protein
MKWSQSLVIRSTTTEFALAFSTTFAVRDRQAAQIETPDNDVMIVCGRDYLELQQR